MLLLALALCGCASKAKTQMQIRRAYAAGEMAAHAQMEQQMHSQQQLAAASQIRILGRVRNPLLTWSEGMTLGRALVEAQYEENRTPSAITIYRNNEPLDIDPQRLLQGEDYPLFPGDIVVIQD